MEEKNALKRKIISNAVAYALIFIAVILTPLLAGQVAKLFDFAVLEWWKRGQLRVFYTEAFTALFWIAEIIGFHFLLKYVKKKEAAAEQEYIEPLEITETEAEAAVSEVVQAEEVKGKKKTKEKAPLLPMKNIAVLFVICAACVLLLSAQIGFQVKVFYDLGERVVLSEIIDFGGTAAKNIVKCIWIVFLLKVAFGLMEGALEKAVMKETTKKWLTWICVAALLLLFGVYDVLYSNNKFLWTYLVFYVAFTAIYALTNRAPVKSYLLILFLYFF